MRILIIISHDVYVRNFISTGAFADLKEAHELYYLSTPLRHSALLEQQGNYVGAIELEPWRTRLYAELGDVLMMMYRHRSSTFRIKANIHMLLRERLKYEVLAAPGLRNLTTWTIMRLTRENERLQQALLDVKPDLIIAPTAVTDPLLIDVARLSKRLKIPTLFLVKNWDNLSSKLVFPEPPDYLGVWGEQSVEHACSIHGMSREQVFVVGAPTFDHYFRVAKETLSSPYPFRYVLFAGCSLPFDEISALRTLEDTIESQGLSDLTIVYRPHPWRQRRKCFDVFEPEHYKHVVIDEQVKESYFRTVRTQDYRGSKAFLPSLDYYPSLLSHAEFMISPLSTMMLESACCETPVLVIAYDDGVHAFSPGTAIHEEHFKGLDTVQGFRVCRDVQTFTRGFLEMAQEALRVSQGQDGRVSMRRQIRWYLYADERSYAQRLRDLVDRLNVAQERRGAAWRG